MVDVKAVLLLCHSAKLAIILLHVLLVLQLLGSFLLPQQNANIALYCWLSALCVFSKIIAILAKWGTFRFKQVLGKSVDHAIRGCWAV